MAESECDGVVVWMFQSRDFYVELQSHYSVVWYKIVDGVNKLIAIWRWGSGFTVWAENIYSVVEFGLTSILYIQVKLQKNGLNIYKSTPHSSRDASIKAVWFCMLMTTARS